MFKIIVCSFLFLFSWVNNFAQQATLSSIEKVLKSSKDGDDEKLYLQTDKAFYLTGEICWFKIYSIDRLTNRPLVLSKVAYLEILDKSNKPVLQCKVALNKGEGSGSLYLPLSLETDHYHIRTYTSWMQNSSETSFFSKVITIVNPAVPPVKSQVIKPEYDVQFFPEGGNLINNIASRVAFRIVNEFGKGLDCKGSILNQANQLIAHFQSFKFGMGNFRFTPRKGEIYHAIIDMPGGMKFQKSFPLASDNGFTMEVSDTLSGSYNVSIHSSAHYTLPTTLVSLFAKKIKTAWEITLQDGKGSIQIDKKLLPGGISSLILFNEIKQAVCERLLFRVQEKRLIIDADSLKQSYKPRSQVKLFLKAKNEISGLEASSLAVSVVLNDTLTGQANENIVSFAMLQSELNGQIESANYYLSPSNPGWATAMENLLMVQGWRHFNLKGVQKPQISYLPELEGHIINGKVINEKNGLPVPNIMAYLSIPGTRLQFYVSKSDSLGNLKFFTRDFFGPAEMVAQVNNLIDSNNRVEIDNPFSKNYLNEKLEPFSMEYNLANSLSSRSISMQVQNVYYASDLRQFKSPGIFNTTFYGIPDQKYLLDNYTRFTTTEEVLREYVRNTQLNIQNKKYLLHVLHPYAKNFFTNTPLILYDGLPIFTADQIVRQDPLKMKQIEVYSKRFFYGPLTCEGIINFNSYRGDFPGIQLDSRALVIDYEGLQIERQFFSPVYQTLEQKNSRMPDFRNTIYWSPKVITNKNGRAQVSFYTSDLKGDFIVVVEGISPQGRLAYKKFNFEVKN